MESNLSEMLKESDAALLIGDDTLSTSVPENLYQYDLGKLWQEFCGYPVVFVVWAVRKEYAKKNKQKLNELVSALKESLSFGLTNLDKVAELAKQTLDESDEKQSTSRAKELNNWMLEFETDIALMM